MAQSDKPKVILLSLIAGLSLLGAGWLLKNLPIQPFKTVEELPESTSVAAEVADNVSTGEKILLDANPSTQKQSAADSYGNNQIAVSMWEASLQQERNDPEALIYLNNARVGDNPNYTIAVPIPAEAEINVAKEILRGAAQAQLQINNGGGIEGKSIKLMVANDRNNPELAKKLATYFSQNSDILGVIGHFSSNVTLEAAEVYQNQGLPVVSPTSSSVALSNVGSYIFRTVSSDCVTGNALADYLTQEMGVKQAAIFFNSGSSYSTSMRDVFKSSMEQKDGIVVAEFNFSQPSFNIVNALAEIKQKEAKALILFPNSSGMNALETLDKTFLIAQLNQGELLLLGSDSLYKPRTLQLGQKSVTDMVIAVPWRTTAANPDFVTEATNLWGGQINWRTALTYDATMALAKAIKTTPSREGIQETMSSPNFSAEGASGEITFLPTGDRAAEVQLVKIQAGNNSGFGYDFVPLSNTYDLTKACQ